MIKVKTVGAAVFGAAVIAFSSGHSADAAIIGDSINYQLQFSNSSSPFTTGTTTVSDPDVELNYTNFDGNSNIGFDIGNGFLNLFVELGLYPRIGANISWNLGDLDFGSAITSVVQTGGPTALNIGFTANSISVVTPDFDDPPNRNDYSFAITTSGATPIPTPALLPRLLGMGIAAWRKRKNEESKQVAETAEV